MSYAKRAIEAYQALRRHGLTGDVGIGVLAGVALATGLYVWGPSGQLLGLPMSIVLGGGAAVAVSLTSASVGLMPQSNRSDAQ